MANHFPDAIMSAFKDTLVNVFWTKKHLREMLKCCEVPSELLASQDWENYKYHIVDPILSVLNSTDSRLGSLRRILHETLAYTDGDHLPWLPRWPRKKTRG